MLKPKSSRLIAHDYRRVLVRTLTPLVVSSFSLFAPTALADEDEGQSPKWYLGAGLTYTDISAGSFGGLSNGNDSTDSDTGMLVTAGYAFGRNFAVEIGYLDGGAPRFESSRGLLCNDPDPCRVEVEQDTEALTIAAVGILPLGSVWEFYGKAGVAAWEARADQTLTSPSGDVSIRGRADLDGTHLLLGLGVGAALGPRVRLRLGYEFFDTDDALLAVDRAAGFQQFAAEVHWRF